MTTLDEAKAIIARMKEANTCECACCKASSQGAKFPWADKLDPERVREYAERQRHRHVWPLAELESLL